MDNLLFSKTHEWVKIDNDIGWVGVSNYAQSELGDIVYVELPKIGDEFTQFSKFATLESTKAAAEVYLPLSGTISEINKELVSNPQWINESPYEKGWLVKIKIKDFKEKDNLLNEDAYREFIEEEKEK
ncbi:MAG: glycine cleavage system protein GcvH [Candidatus Omnitrophica bacterium]|nr:glycine cleavage system protein GcvH [Candidatus Omnitrophota bacterium]MCM8826166.1 glycine cleavage system protein GcvH [Candidatus Omnitrophota bacterium]